MRTAAGGIQHLTVDGIVSLTGCKARGGASGFLAGTPRPEDEQEDGGGEREPGECPPPQRGKDCNHRRPRFQSSNRA